MILRSMVFPDPTMNDRLREAKGGAMTRKHERQGGILELVASHVVGSQEELRQLLLERGMDVTQATLSRDLRDLPLARVSEAGGARYVLPESLAADDDKPLLANLLPQLFSRVRRVGALGVA